MDPESQGTWRRHMAKVFFQRDVTLRVCRKVMAKHGIGIFQMSVGFC